MGKGEREVAELEPEDQDERAEEAPETEPAQASAEDAEPAPDTEPEAAELPEELQLTDDELVRLVGGLLFASPDPLPPSRIAKLISPTRAFPVKRVEEALATLTERLAAAGLPVGVRTLAGGAQLLTDPDLAVELSRLLASRKVERMTPAGLETLAVIAYRQPVTKSEIEAIRGVQAGPVLRNLVDRNLVRVTGRADQPGNPLQYGTTKEFLERFGLGSLADLPRDPELLRE